MSEALFLSDYQQLLTTLRVHVRRHPRSLQAIERQLGWSRSYLSRKLAGAISLSTEQLLKILKIVDLNLSELEAKASWVDVEGLLEGLLPEGSRNPAPIVELRRVARKLTERDCTSEQLRGPAGSLIEVLHRIDRQRYRDPWASAGQAFALAVKVAPTLEGLGGSEIFCRAASVYAASCRLGGAPEYSIRVLLVALCSSGRLRSRLRICLLRQASYLLMSHDRTSDALLVLDLAEVHCLRSEDRWCRGRTAVARGAALVYLGEFEAAERSFRIVLSELEGRINRRFLGSAHQGLARIHLETDDLGNAARELERAGRFFSQSDLYSQGKLDWTVGRWARQCGQRDLAEQKFRSAVGHLSSINPFDSALASLDWIDLLVEVGETAEAVVIARNLAELMEPLKSNTIASNTIVALRRKANAGRLTLKLIEIARKRISGGRLKGIRPPEIS